MENVVLTTSSESKLRIISGACQLLKVYLRFTDLVLALRGPCPLREATDDLPKDPKTAELPKKEFVMMLRIISTLGRLIVLSTLSFQLIAAEPERRRHYERP